MPSPPPIPEPVHGLAERRIRQALAEGFFDDVEGSGQPIPGLDRSYDPDWWVKRFIERENIAPLLAERQRGNVPELPGVAGNQPNREERAWQGE